MKEVRKPQESRMKRSGLFYASTSLTLLSFLIYSTPVAWAFDGATEALEMRYQAELAIAAERAVGHAKLADAMTQALPELLQEYLMTRDGTIALDTVDAAYVEEQFKVARAMDEPGVALALDVFSGPGTGYEHEIQKKISDLADYRASVEAVAGRHEREMDRGERDRVSERNLDSYEKVMERQMEKAMEKVERHLETAATSEHRFDSKFDAKLDAQLDAVAQRIEKIKEIAQTNPQLAEKLTQKMAEKAERLAEKGQVHAEVAEVLQEAVKETVQEIKKEEAVQEARVEQPAAERTLTRAERGAQLEKERVEAQAAADKAAADRAARGAELAKERAEEKARADAAAAARLAGSGK